MSALPAHSDSEAAVPTALFTSGDARNLYALAVRPPQDAREFEEIIHMLKRGDSKNKFQIVSYQRGEAGKLKQIAALAAESAIRGDVVPAFGYLKNRKNDADEIVILDGDKSTELNVVCCTRELGGTTWSKKRIEEFPTGQYFGCPIIVQDPISTATDRSVVVAVKKLKDKRHFIAFARRAENGSWTAKEIELWRREPSGDIATLYSRGGWLHAFLPAGNEMTYSKIYGNNEFSGGTRPPLTDDLHGRPAAIFFQGHESIVCSSGDRMVHMHCWDGNISGNGDTWKVATICEGLSYERPASAYIRGDLVVVARQGLQLHSYRLQMDSLSSGKGEMWDRLAPFGVNIVGDPALFIQPRSNGEDQLVAVARTGGQHLQYFWYEFARSQWVTAEPY